MTHPKHARTDHDVHPLIRERWSPRAFDATRPVDASLLASLFEAARWAPSSRNEQPWRFVVVDRRQQPELHARVVETLSRGNQAWAPAAPLLVAVVVKLHVGDDPAAANRHAYYDTGHAVGLLTMQAQALGLSVRQMEGFDRQGATAVLRIPESYEIAVVMAMGYAGDPSALEMEKHRELEHTSRSRRPIAGSVYAGTWGTDWVPPQT
ncbi:MAG: nitroreductase family protein [Vicinamibacterales bacterium]